MVLKEEKVSHSWLTKFVYWVKHCVKGMSVESGLQIIVSQLPLEVNYHGLFVSRI